MRHYQPEICSTSKTYATPENAAKAAMEKFGNVVGHEKLTFITMPVEVKGKIRHVPVFIGERAIQAGVHFHFHVLG